MSLRGKIVVFFELAQQVATPLPHRSSKKKQEAPSSLLPTIISGHFNLMTSKANMDKSITIRTNDGMEFDVIQDILSNSSPYLKAQFENDLLEKSKGVVNVIDFSGIVMEELVKFIYLRMPTELNITKDIDIELYVAASMYQVPELCQICAEAIKSRIYDNHQDDLIKILEFAVTFKDVKKLPILNDIYNCCISHVAV